MNSFLNRKISTIMCFALGLFLKFLQFMFRNTWIDDSDNPVLPDPKVVCPTDANIIGIEHHCVKLITSEKTYDVIFHFITQYQF